MKPRHNQPVKSSFSKRKTVIKKNAEPSSYKTNKEVEFVLEKPGARFVALAGSFNNWDPQISPMSRDLEGEVWKVRIPLKPGRYEYRFVVDGQWLSDPNAEESVRNEFGSRNSVIIV